MSTPDEDRDLIAAYALGATSEADQAHVDALLDEHPELLAELDEHRGLLASMTPVVEVDPALADRLMDSLSARSASTLQLVAPDPTTAPSPHPTARQAGRTARAILAVAATVGLLLVGIGLVRQDREEGPADLGEMAVAALDDPTARVVELDDLDSGTVTARAALLADGRSYLVVDDLAPLTDTETYQLWVLGDEDDPPISLGPIGRGTGDEVATFVVTDTATAVAISREPASGSVAPTEVVAIGAIG